MLFVTHKMTQTISAYKKPKQISFAQGSVLSGSANPAPHLNACAKATPNHASRAKFAPFLKWAGGKRDLAQTLLEIMPSDFNAYFEPFLGGGAVFFALQNAFIESLQAGEFNNKSFKKEVFRAFDSKALINKKLTKKAFAKGALPNALESKKSQTKRIVLSDKNSELINAYIALKNSAKELLAHLKSLQETHSKEQFYQIRALDRKADFQNLDSTFRAARFIYLNKTCFNGLCRHNAKGEFNTPLGSYKNPRIYDRDLLLSASAALQGADIECADFESVCLRAKRGDFIYFDPPYFPLNVTSSFVGYVDNFLENDQLRLCELFKRLDSKGVKVLLSNSNTPFIRALYKDFRIYEVKAKRAINCKGDKRGKVSELIIRGNYE